jgi:hypothetical protein
MICCAKIISFRVLERKKFKLICTFLRYFHIYSDTMHHLKSTETCQKYSVTVIFYYIFDLNTNLNYLSSNVLSLYCIFDVQNFVLCLNRELIKMIDYKFMLKLQCKTTFNSVFAGKKINNVLKNFGFI